MKVAFIGVPAHGHTNPTLPVAQELMKRGHEVLFYNAETFRQKIGPTGVRFCPYPEPIPPEHEIVESMHEIITTSLLIAHMSEHLTPFLLAEIAREQPDLIIYDSLAMWGYIAARTHHIPHICSITHFVLEGSQRSIGFGTLARYIWTTLPHVSYLLRWKQRMAQHYGKDIVGGITEYADLNLIFTSQAFHPENHFIDGRFQFVGASIDLTTRDGEFSFETLADGPRVYISLGTINHLNPVFYQRAFEAFANYPAQFILATGRHTDMAQIGDVPPNFIAQPYVPQLAVLQHVDAFITHGGLNSIHEGFYYGVPEVVVPHHLEQLLNGKRVAETGAGILLGARYPYGRITADDLRQALNTVLHEATYRVHSQKMGETLKSAGGYMRAVEEIEAFIQV